MSDNIKRQLRTVCFTGHRELDSNAAEKIPMLLKQLLRIMIENGSRRFLAGGALGFDTVAALCVLELKKDFPHISLELILPCKNQTKMWSEENRAMYNYILSRADRVQFLHDTYTSTCMHDRNRCLVDKCDICVAYLEHKGGGTAFTVSYALKNEKELINLAELL